MRRIILLVLATGICTFANAQRLKLKEGALDKLVLQVSLEGPTLAAVELQKELDLTQEQYYQVMQLNQQRYEQIIKVEEVHKEDALVRSKSIYTINMEADKALSSVLDPRQLRLFLELEGRQDLRLVSEHAEE
ncbi:hypothetical protein [Pontibacter sp. H249]|uniref:hypothetical protein n=1 Tax=Pontibacter sp. H249 TaxID=3133420 RepID=UPI0030BA58D6